jgi:prepilin-type N-terminal cleavage/methylation domain-containing protein
MKNYGFTLLETLVAVTILTMVIIGPLTLAINSISAAMISQNQIIAFYLAQEAIEYIGNIRDSNFLQGNDWLDGLADCAGADGCYVDIPHLSDFPNNITACIGECPKIKYDDGGYYYNYQVGNDTIFIRTVKITPNIGGNSDEVKVEVVAQWLEKFGGQKSFILQKNLFKWK